MFTAKLFSRPAPSFAARMIPSPAPVMTMNSRSARRRAKRRARSYRGFSDGIRADPKTATPDHPYDLVHGAPAAAGHGVPRVRARLGRRPLWRFHGSPGRAADGQPPPGTPSVWGL